MGGQTAVITTMVSSFPGVIAGDSTVKDIMSYVNAEPSLQMPFGTVVMQGVNDNDALTLTPTNVAKILGIVAYSAAYQKNIELGTVVDASGRLGLQPGTNTGVLKRGRMWVRVEEAVNPASLVRVRCTTAGLGSGAFRTTSAGAGLSMVLTGAKYLDSVGINGLARVEFDCILRSTFTAD